MREGRSFLFMHSLIEPKQMLLLLRFTGKRFPVYKNFNTISYIKSMWLLHFPVLLHSCNTGFGIRDLNTEHPTDILLFIKASSDRTRGNSLKKGRFRLGIRKKFFYDGGDETLKQVVQSCGCPIPGSIQGQVGWGLSNVIWSNRCRCLWQGGRLDELSLEVPSNSDHSIILIVCLLHRLRDIVMRREGVWRALKIWKPSCFQSPQMPELWTPSPWLSQITCIGYLWTRRKTKHR